MSLLRPRRKKTRYPEISWRYLDSMSPEERLNVPEENLQRCIIAYIEETYPGVLFCANVASNIKLGWMKARLQKAAGNRRAWPDLFIASPCGNFHGCFIELKKDGVSIYGRDKKPATPHIGEQIALLDQLGAIGYCACMAVGWVDAKNVIDDYLQHGAKR